MEIRYTRHARQRMTERRILAAEVREVLESPDECITGDEGEIIAVRRFAWREVRVVYTELEPERFVVYTVIGTRIREE